MACKVQKRISMRRKFHILRALSHSNYAKRTSIAKSTDLYIYKIMIALESIKREYENLLATRRESLKLLNHVQESKKVKVEKVMAGTFVLRVTCDEGGDKLVSILEAFEKMCLNVEKAKVSCENGFSLEAIVVAEDQTLDAKDVIEALLKAIGLGNYQSGKKDSVKD
ncbi:hypothetical protein Lal_00050097 [Lupinus albus]|uniref:Plant bHLH transcription factor ACT-like domain-containing protein n=1 Tax=Lupinus albus TaxID=3870 RepID=A0A6A5LZ33_LUPAL|nr:hypothetical protein Lalb_Chr12g0204971 [Lupinus albus]KAF1867664.1 hypothetical protein Lal_00050097 [Lupinus albus]